MEFHSNGRLATVKVTEELDANGVEQLIVKLAMLRSEMTPPVPMKPPSEPDGDRHILAANDSELMVALQASGRFRIWMRNIGIGWCGYSVPASTAVAMARFVLSRAAPGDPALDLIGNSDGKRH